MSEFLNKLGKLIGVKPAIALGLTAVYAYLAVTGHIQPDAFENVFILIVGFYFGQTTKNSTDVITRND